MAWPEPFGIVVELIAVQVRSVGIGRFERVTVPVKPAIGFTIIVDVAGVVPSATTILGRVASILKSGTEIELNAQADVARDSIGDAKHG